MQLIYSNFLRENTDAFISLDKSIYGICLKRVNILYLFVSNCKLSCFLELFFSLVLKIMIIPTSMPWWFIFCDALSKQRNSLSRLHFVSHWTLCWELTRFPRKGQIKFPWQFPWQNVKFPSILSLKKINKLQKLRFNMPHIKNSLTKISFFPDRFWNSQTNSWPLKMLDFPDIFLTCINPKEN